MKKFFQYILLAAHGFVFAQSANQNYIVTTQYKIPAQFTDDIFTGSMIPPTVSNDDKTVSITYFDGLGRPIQQIAHRQSGTGNDLITHMEYDAFGRKKKEYLPYANSTPSLNYNSGASSSVLNFYNTPTFDNTGNPYSETHFEASPLNRVLKLGAPGNDWSVNPSGTDKTIKTEYKINASGEVKQFLVTTTWNASSGLYDITLSQNGNYTAGMLYKTIIKDENWTTGNNNTTEEYKDKDGRVILKRTYDAGTPHETYYIYDMYGNLTYVLPPMVDTNNTITSTVLDGLCYQYKYDKFNRLVEKKLPGKQWEFIVYDKLDRVVATGPHFAPFIEDVNIGWLITKYDVFGRATYTGWYSGHYADASHRKILQDLYNNATIINEEKSTSNSSINSITVAYTNNVFPTSGFYLLTVNYYDNYNFPGAASVPTTVEGQTVLQNLKGIVTGNWVRVLTKANEFNGNNTTLFYDKKARVIKTSKTNYLGGYTEISSSLDYIGKTIYTITSHKLNSVYPAIQIKDTYEYTLQDRLSLHKQQINTDPEQLIVKNTYNSLGQLTSKNVGGTDVSGSLGLQKVDFSYNIRGWLTGINNEQDYSQLGILLGAGDIFGFKLRYNSLEGDVIPNVKSLYNGNIAETQWKTITDGGVLRKYSYQYDDLNRLKKATYQKPNNFVTTTNAYNEELSYDKNGNITSLMRNGAADDNTEYLIDNLTYSYDTSNPNQLVKVFDSSNVTEGFRDDSEGLSDPDNDFTYDLNGNMLEDTNQGISVLKYNHLNLPTRFGRGTEEMHNIYDALGGKAEYIILGQGIVGGNLLLLAKTYYQDGFDYSAEDITIQNPEGYIWTNLYDNIYYYIFNYKDHLGNIRLNYCDFSMDNTITIDEITEENNYYPYGLKHSGYNNDAVLQNKYKFNGKEWLGNWGLNFYDFGARNYDPAIGRWMNIDPLAEKYSSISPYTYAVNNPVYFIDPDGMRIYNGDKINKENAQKEYKEWSDLKKTNAEYLGISVNASKSEWKKAALAKGGKEEWAASQGILDQLEQKRQDVEFYTDMEKKTDEKIQELQSQAGILFDKMDALSIDIYMTSVNSLGNNDGQNNTMFDLSNPNISLKSKFGPNSTVISTVNSPSDKRTTLWVSQHELGHADYIIGDIRAYYQWIKNNNINVKYHDGHAKGDPSGKLADEYAKTNFKKK